MSGAPARGAARAGEPERSGTGGEARSAIGEVAARAEVSARTVRYYEEIGLLAPSGRSSGGARRYAEDDIARLVRIRELQQLLGFDLGEIRTILQGEDQLGQLRSEFESGVTAQRHRQMLAEAAAVNDRLRATVAGKQVRLKTMQDELREKAKLYRRRARELDAGSS